MHNELTSQEGDCRGWAWPCQVSLWRRSWEFMKKGAKRGRDLTWMGVSVASCDDGRGHMARSLVASWAEWSLPTATDKTDFSPSSLKELDYSSNLREVGNGSPLAADTNAAQPVPGLQPCVTWSRKLSRARLDFRPVTDQELIMCH